MRILLFAGASLLALASPAVAQEVQLDTLEPADEAPVQAAPAPTGDAVKGRKIRTDL